MTTDNYYLNKKKTIGLLLACLVLIILFFLLGWTLGTISERAKMEKVNAAEQESEAGQESGGTEETKEPDQKKEEKTSSMLPGPPIHWAGATGIRLRRTGHDIPV